jgi:NAD(P)H-nitrite reductase large subunit
MTHYVIVGSSVAGQSAAEAIRERDTAAAITIVSEESHGFYSRPGLAYVLRGDIPDKQLVARTADDWRNLNARVIVHRADAVQTDRHQVNLANGETLHYDRLLLATGSTAVPADFPGHDLEGVVKLDNLDDARRILQLAGRRKTAVVIGGGITALELVEGLRARGVKVHYLLRGERYWANVLDETESRLVADRLRDEGVVLHMHTQIKQAVGKRARLVGVETQTGEKIDCHILAVAIGVRPRLELARSASLRIERGIVVDEYLRTSAPDVYAAGDVAQVNDPRSGRSTLDVLWSTALAQGRAAGQNMAGAHIPYVKAVPMNVTQLAGLVTTIIGAVGSGRDEDLVTISRGDSEAWRLLPQAWVVTDQHEVNRVRLLLDERRIVGAVVIGDQTWARPLHELIAAQADITPIRTALLSEQAAAFSHLQKFYQNWISARPERAQRAQTDV